MNASVSFLKEIAVRAKWDGSFTEEWATIRRGISSEGDLKKVPGHSDIKRLKAWAEKEGLFIDFDVELVAFSSAIRTVTFWNGHPAVGDGDAGQPGATEKCPSPDEGEGVGGNDSGQVCVGMECNVHDDFDWHSIEGARDGDEEAWAAVSRDADCRVIEQTLELHVQTGAVAQPEGVAQAETAAHHEAEVHLEEEAHADGAVANTPAGKRRRGVRARSTGKTRKRASVLTLAAG